MAPSFNISSVEEGLSIIDGLLELSIDTLSKIGAELRHQPPRTRAELEALCAEQLDPIVASMTELRRAVVLTREVRARLASIEATVQ